MPAPTAVDAEAATAAALGARLRPVTGMLGPVGAPSPLDLRPGSPGLPIATCPTGELAWALDEVAGYVAASGRPDAGRLDGAGGALDADLAAQLAAAEALERYCSVVYRPEQQVTATADELGDQALDLDTLPRLSAAELARPGQRLRAPRRDRPLRWVRAVRLHDARPTWVPAGMVWLCYPRGEDERITVATSTGCALHPDPQQALLGGLLEVVERDAVAVLWRQRLRLPELAVDRPGPLADLLDRFAGGDAAVTLFDATLDLGVPTVFAVHVEEHNPRLRQVVGAGADLDPERAAVKAVRETVSCRLALEWQPPPPADPGTFEEVTHGALHMGAPERAPAFDFLLGPRPPVPTRRLSELAAGVRSDRGPGPALRGLVGRLLAAGLECYAVDLTTDEAREVGCTVVKVLVPGLQPLSFSPSAQFLGSPRLYRAPAAAGYPVRPEAELNPHPQPFA